MERKIFCAVVVTLATCLYSYAQRSMSMDLNMHSDVGFQILVDSEEDQILLSVATKCGDSNECTGLIALNPDLSLKWKEVYSAFPERLNLSGIDGLMKYHDSYYFISNTNQQTTGVSGYRISKINTTGESLDYVDHFSENNVLSRSIKMSADSNLYIFGHVTITDTSNLLVNVLDDSLNVLNSRYYTRPGYREFNPETMNFFDSGDILLSGFAVSETPSPNPRMAWLIVTGPTGNLKWERIYGDSSFQHRFKSIVLSNGNIAISWIKTEDIHNPQPFVYDWPPYVGILNSDGELIEDYIFYSEFEKYILNIRASSEGGLFGVGYDANLSDGELGFPSAGWVFKVDSTGELIWERTIVDTSNNGSIGINMLYDIVELESGQLLCVGGKVDTIGQSVLNGNTWILLLDGNGCVVQDCGMVEILTDQVDLQNTKKADFSVYPNPVKDDKIVVRSEQNYITSVSVLDYLGQTIRTRRFYAKQSEVQISINGVPAGTYMLMIENHDGQKSLSKIVVLK